MKIVFQIDVCFGKIESTPKMASWERLKLGFLLKEIKITSFLPLRYFIGNREILCQNFLYTADNMYFVLKVFQFFDTQFWQLFCCIDLNQTEVLKQSVEMKPIYMIEIYLYTTAVPFIIIISECVQPLLGISLFSAPFDLTLRLFYFCRLDSNVFELLLT